MCFGFVLFCSRTTLVYTRDVSIIERRWHNHNHVEKKLRSTGIGTIIVGDLNVHSIRWLQYSSCNSVEGEYLHNVCKEMGLQQRVAEPTREDHLLDLVLTD